MDEESSLVMEAFRDYETAYAAVQTAAYKAVKFNLLVAQRGFIEDTNWDRELRTAMDELKLADAYLHFTLNTARDSVHKLLVQLQEDLDAIQAEPESADFDSDEENDKDFTEAKPEARAEHNKESDPNKN